MEPTIEMNKDSMVVDLRYYRHHKLERRDVVVYFRGGTYYCKRVVALPGDTVQVTNGALLVNGESQVEPYAIPVTQPNDAAPELFNYGPQKIAAGQIFVMGDNRPLSLDSRTLGPLPAADLKGKVLYLIDKGVRKKLK